MLTRLNIKRFRGIPSLALEDFGRVNIFIGGNGSGKSSILESIFLISNPTDPRPATNLGPWREQPPATTHNDDSISSFFHLGDLSHGPEFEFVSGNGQQTLTISRALDAPTQMSSSSSESPSETAELSDFVRGLVFVFQPEPKTSHTSRLLLTGAPGVHQVNIQKYYDKSPRCFYIHARRATSTTETAALLTGLSKNYKSHEFLAAIKTFDDRVFGIEPGVRPGGAATVLVDMQYRTKLPSQVLGDGFCRTTLIATGLFYDNCKVLAIDEIDSGLHASVMGRFWKNLLELAIHRDKQVFCTTHDEEMLSRTIDAFSGSPGALRIYRIDRLKDDQLVATKYDHESYRKSDQLGLDIR